MKEQIYDIAFAVNDGYAMPLCVALQSIAETSSARFNVHILCISLSAESQRLISEQCIKASMCCHFYFVKNRLPDGILNGKYGRQGLETMMRFLLPTILRTKHSVLYLDCDIIATDDITQIFKECRCWHYKAAAMAEDCTADIQGERDKRFSQPYFNAGVMYMYLDYWRIKGLSTKAFQLAISEPDLPLHDQDILNIILRDKILPLSKANNAQNGLWWKHAKQHNCRLFFGEPVIVHFTGPHKPWKATCCNPYRAKWLELYKHTFGKEFKQKHRLWGAIARLWYRYSPFVKFKEQYINIK